MTRLARSLRMTKRRAAEQIVEPFPFQPEFEANWRFPLLACRGDFIIDPASMNCEADSITERQPEVGQSQLGAPHEPEA